MKKAPILRKSSSGVGGQWHPNFRIEESLPDIKAVRTSFFTTAVFVTLAVMCSMFVGVREYSRMELEESIRILETENFGYQARNNMALNRNKVFRDHYNRLQSVESFLSDQLVGSEFLMSISSKVPDKMALVSLEYRKEMVKISGEIVGSREIVTGVIDSFILDLKKAKVDQGQFTDYDLMSLDGTGDGTAMRFQILVSKREEDKKGKK